MFQKFAKSAKLCKYCTFKRIAFVVNEWSLVYVVNNCYTVSNSNTILIMFHMWNESAGCDFFFSLCSQWSYIFIGNNHVALSDQSEPQVYFQSAKSCVWQEAWKLRNIRGCNSSGGNWWNVPTNNFFSCKFSQDWHHTTKCLHFLAMPDFWRGDTWCCTLWEGVWESQVCAGHMRSSWICHCLA